MKIAYFINQYPKVSHTFIRREILALERQGFEVVRIALRGWDGDLPDPEDQAERTRTQYILRNGVLGLIVPLLATAIRAPVRLFQAFGLALRMSRQGHRPWLYHLISVVEACKVVHWTRTADVSRIHAHFGTNSAEVVMLADALGGPPYSFTIHGAEEFVRPMGLAEKIRRAKFVVAISSFGRSQIYMRADYPDWGKVHIVHCGLERAFYEVAHKPVANSRKLVCVGRLCAAKGQILLVEAAARLHAKGVPFELVLAGDGPLRSQIELLIRAHDLTDRIRLTGWIGSGQVREEILSARAMVLPSFSEGLPVVLMEAMALRRPVLTTYVAGIPELVRHRQDGWLFPAGSVEDLAAAMEQCLLSPPEELEALGNSAHARIVERHSIDVESAKLAHLFRMPMGVDRSARESLYAADTSA